MLTRTLQSFSHSYKPLATSALYSRPSYYGSTWRPNIPQYEIRIDKSSYHFAHPEWDLKAAENIKQTYYEPKDYQDRVAKMLVRILRKGFDFVTRYNPQRASEPQYLKRFITLEALAAVPGMIGGMIRHMRSLGHLNHDRGRIHYLLKEAENQRVHLFTFLDLRQPGILIRFAILTAQAAFIVFYAGLYTASQKTAHRLVGYMKEESIKNYTECIDDLAAGKLPYWAKADVPKKARNYWGLPQDSTIREVLLCIRADEVLHREMNHRFAELKPDQDMEYLGNLTSDQRQQKVLKEESHE